MSVQTPELATSHPEGFGAARNRKPLTPAQHALKIAAQKRYRDKNRDKIRARTKTYAPKKREYDKKQWRAMTETDREANRIAVRKYQKKNRSRLREQNRAYQRSKLPTPTRACPTLCECCGGPSTGRGTLHLDHSHTTNQFRGWLCHHCNLGIGSLGDDLRGIQRAAAYLQRGEHS
jgi:hypothetical protein